MGTLISLFGMILLFFLILSGLFLIMAPTVGQRLLRKTATFAGLFFILIIAPDLVWRWLRSIDSIVPLAAFAALSLVAYLVRENRVGARKRSDKPHPVERIPVMPRHIPGDGK